MLRVFAAAFRVWLILIALAVAGVAGDFGTATAAAQAGVYTRRSTLRCRPTAGYLARCYGLTLRAYVRLAMTSRRSPGSAAGTTCQAAARRCSSRTGFLRSSSRSSANE